jgi:hypothetical protein
MREIATTEETFMAIPGIDGPFVIQHGDVWRKTGTTGKGAESRLGNDLVHVCDGTGELGMVHDGESLLHAGSARSAEEYLKSRKPRFDQMNEMLDDMGEPRVEVMLVRLPVSQAIVDEMNSCLACTGRVAKLEKFLTEIGEQDPSLLGRPVYPSASGIR